MRHAVARSRYLERHIEPGLFAPPRSATHWHRVLVIPAYRESAALLARLRELRSGDARVLVVLVLNRPDTDSDRDANQPLRCAVQQLPGAQGSGIPLYRLPSGNSLLLLDIETHRGPTPAAQGVGLARKVGFDQAWLWIDQGCVHSRWIYSTDADATLPPDYFHRLSECRESRVAATFPFHHVHCEDRELDEATALYELRLHHYVLGLRRAGSAYSHHALGSCLAVTSDAYPHVRGFPRRAGGEDFYLLNKLAKLGAVEQLSGRCVEIAARYSDRVPFGTGPGVTALAGADPSVDTPCFYHPAGFDALRGVLEGLIRPTADSQKQWSIRLLKATLQSDGLDAALVDRSISALEILGIERLVTHLNRQGSDAAQATQHIHNWFDGLRTLRFLHMLRDHYLGTLSLREVVQMPHSDLPASAVSIGEQRAAMRELLQWQVMP